MIAASNQLTTLLKPLLQEQSYRISWITTLTKKHKTIATEGPTTNRSSWLYFRFLSKSPSMANQTRSLNLWSQNHTKNQEYSPNLSAQASRVLLSMVNSQLLIVCSTWNKYSWRRRRRNRSPWWRNHGWLWIVLSRFSTKKWVIKKVVYAMNSNGSIGVDIGMRKARAIKSEIWYRIVGDEWTCQEWELGSERRP